MSSLSFFASTDDLRELIRFVFDETDLRVFEAYSRVNHELREFRNLEELDRERPTDSSHGRLHLRMFSPSVTQGPEIVEFELTESAGGGVRRKVEDPSQIQIVQQGVREVAAGEALFPSDIANWNEKGAYQRSAYPDEQLEQIDWRELERLSRRLIYRIRKKMAVAKFNGQPILPDVYRQMENGLKLWCSASLVDLQSDKVERL